MKVIRRTITINRYSDSLHVPGETSKLAFVAILLFLTFPHGARAQDSILQSNGGLPLSTDADTSDTHSKSLTSPYWDLSGSNITYQDGSVGIGVSFPPSPLTVAGSGGPIVRLYSGDSGNAVKMNFYSGGNVGVPLSGFIGYNSGGQYLDLGNEETGGDIRLLSSRHVRFFTGSPRAEMVTFTSLGRVGIGGISPLAPLHVSGNGGSESTFLVTRTATGPLASFEGTHSVLTIGQASTGGGELEMFADSAGTKTVQVSSSPGSSSFFNAGNVGIGTADPQHELEVNGTVRAREVIVTTDNWPDFVFEEGYRLTSLADVEESIQLLGHLPGIPSAAEVARNGVDVGNMQLKLLQKIEELTLHMIALKKENDRMQERLKLLEVSDTADERGER